MAEDAPTEVIEVVDFLACHVYQTDVAGLVRTVYTGPSPLAHERGRHPLLGRVVRIEGRLFRVKGVETRALGLPRPAGEWVGLLAEPVTPVSDTPVLDTPEWGEEH